MDRIINEVIPKLMDETCDPAMASYTEEQVEAWLRWLVDSLPKGGSGCPVCRTEARSPETAMCEQCWVAHGQHGEPCDVGCGCHDADDVEE